MFSFRKTLLASLIFVLFSFGAVTVARADTVTLSASDSGWYNNLGFHDSTNKNYLAGNLVGTSFNNFFVFNLSGVSGTITGAQIRLYTAIVTGAGAFTLHDITTMPAVLSSNQTTRTDIFNDLSGGLLFGSTTITPADTGAVITINLTQAAITALQNSPNATFAVGGFFDTAAGTYAFGASQDGSPDHRNQLVLQTTPTVPESATLLLLGIGLSSIAATFRRRRAATKKR